MSTKITNEIFESYRKEQKEINEAKEFLKSKGMYVDCLWQIEDVTDIYDCSEQEAYEILDSVLGSDCSPIFERIDIVADMMGIKRKEDSDGV
jgi:hypothetical protein